jgi:Circularly permutated YpsA SLOG family
VAQPGEHYDADSGLRAALHTGPGLTVLTGGQTGVDTRAARTALAASLRVQLVFPRGLRQEDGRLTASRRRRLAGARLHELASAAFRFRTWTCVYLADAVVLLDPAGGAGCRETARAAAELGRPLLATGPGELTRLQVAAFLDREDVSVLVVAGCRASVLARGGAGTQAGLRRDLAAITSAAAERDHRLRAAGR